MTVKDTIVIRSVIVPAGNAMANFFQLLNRGVPFRHVVKGAAAKTAEINQYIKGRAREIELEAELRAAKAKGDWIAERKLQNQLTSIQDSHKRLSIWPLIEAGEFATISNGQVMVEDLAIAHGKWSQYVQDKIDQLPDGVRNGVRYGLVARDTALFQGLARAIQYGDFVARAILYDDLVKRQKVEKKQALATGATENAMSVGMSA